MNNAELAAAMTEIKQWPQASHEAAIKTMEKYGPPDEVTPSRLAWFDHDPWSRVAVYRDEIDHDFPSPHKDVLEQAVPYRVPLDKIAELAAFDGSVIVDRTKGELIARCGGEPGNVLALNLAHEIVQGVKDAKAARQAYVETLAAEKAGQKPALADHLLFEIEGSTADPGRT